MWYYVLVMDNAPLISHCFLRKNSKGFVSNSWLTKINHRNLHAFFDKSESCVVG
jgi:hypothetical protein